MFILSLLLLVASAFGGEIAVDIAYHPADFDLKFDGNYWNIDGNNCVLVGESGGPEYLAEPINVLLPPMNSAKSIRIISTEYEVLAEDVVLAPFQPPTVRPMPGLDVSPGFLPPNPQIYSQDDFVPSQPAKFSGGGNFSGYSLAGFIVYPVRYNPALRKIEYLKSLKISVEYEPAQILHPQKRSPKSAEIFAQMVRGIVKNPEEVTAYSHLWATDVGTKDYAVVCAESYSTLEKMDEFRLALRRQGWNDTLITVESTSSFPGIDEIERLRNALKDLYESTGIAAVALVGDVNAVPYREGYAMECGEGYRPDEDYIPCDLYFADYDGDWNANGTYPYGEVADSVDLYPDVIIGRPSVGSIDEFNNWANKYITYVEEPPADFGGEALFLGEVLWTDPFTDAGIGKDMVRDDALPTRFDLTRLYETLGNETMASVTAAFNDGYGAVNHDGHAFYSVMGVGDDYFGNSDADALHNYPRCGVIYSIGCWPAAFDYDCIAEHFITNPDGGFVAFVGNSRYGWGSPGNPGYGYSDYFDHKFWKNIFEGYPSIGEALAVAKAYYAPFARWANVWRWKIYEINVLGEPGMLLWQDVPIAQEHELPTIVESGGSPLTLTFDGDISVVAIQDGEILDRVFGNGSVELWLDPLTSSPVEISAFSPDGFKRLFIDTIYVDAGSPYLALDYLSQNTISPAETISIDFHIRNYTTSGSDFSWNPEAVSGGTILSFDPGPTSISGDDTFALSAVICADSALVDGDEFLIELNCVCGDDTFPISVAITAIAPVLSVNTLRLAGTYVGDAAIAGENYSMFAQLINSGSDVYDGDILVSSPSAYLTVSGTATVSAFTGTTYTLTPIDLAVSSGCPSPSVQPVVFSFANGEIDTFYLSIGLGRFYDDAESTPEFTMDTPWHQTTDDYYDGAHSYRCADTATGLYPDDADASLTSEQFVIGEHPVLSFWMRYEVTTLEDDGGTDGLYIYIYDVDDDSLCQLEFIGGGGALPTTNFEVGWTHWHYKIPFPPGTDVQVKFRFTSDYGDDAQGFFIDDATVAWKSTEVETTADISSAKNLPAAPMIIANPNPFNDDCRIVLKNLSSDASVDILDISGRIVSHFDVSMPSAEIVWRPKSSPSGIYLVRAKCEDTSIEHKIYYIR